LPKRDETPDLGKWLALFLEAATPAAGAQAAYFFFEYVLLQRFELVVDIESNHGVGNDTISSEGSVLGETLYTKVFSYTVYRSFVYFELSYMSSKVVSGS